MNKKDEEKPPSQYEGGSSNTEHSVEANSQSAAIDLYNSAREKLLDVNHWKQIAGSPSAEFQLVDSTGKELNRDITEGDFFRIDIPGPGSSAGDGYDWVRIESISESNEDAESSSISIRVRPASSPTNTDQHVAHFFSDDATSNFIVSRKQLTVTAGVYGRNEVPNTKTDKLLDKARNALVGVPAAAGFSKLQWKKLVKGLLAADDN